MQSNALPLTASKCDNKVFTLVVSPVLGATVVVLSLSLFGVVGVLIISVLGAGAFSSNCVIVLVHVAPSLSVTLYVTSYLPAFLVSTVFLTASILSVRSPSLHLLQ